MAGRWVKRPHYFDRSWRIVPKSAGLEAAALRQAGMPAATRLRASVLERAALRRFFARLMKSARRLAHSRTCRTLKREAPRGADFELEFRCAIPETTVVKPLTSYTCKLTESQANALKEYFVAHGYKFREVPYARFAAEKDKLNAVFYESGKLVLQGKGTQEFIEFVLEPEILKEARIGYEAVLNPELLMPRLGVDESGKGDFFGPLCVAGVYVNESVINAWKDAGIRDSKNISSDKRIKELAELIRNTPGCVTTVVPIGNEAYNRLYVKMKSVNTLLAWGHARVIENLMGQRHRMNPLPVRAISDQFAANKATVASALMSMGREIELVQKHRAEEDVSVAAASILARHEFVTRLAGLERQYEIKLPRGASAAVDMAAKEFLAKFGVESLGKVAKLHFRTALRAQGLPEPPRIEWSSKRRPRSEIDQK